MFRTVDDPSIELAATSLRFWIKAGFGFALGVALAVPVWFVAWLVWWALVLGGLARLLR